MTRTRARIADRRRPATGRAPAPVAGRPPRDAAGPRDRAWPTAEQVWNWAEGAVLFGHGPGPAPFL
ncbi:hypothetical protein [Actinacidiphila rubida]|uniref:Uncharacterized protein n=1 Tax=Actinacidiphila rubida TaxID=310780 RepID=A0A1H8U1A7_9ACTN|nr:hypothetical protein [Actinacidiphila rubida]SEO96836.1 hypothetical protein SAMN05216267_106216 [Actinacidiphila rubida]